MTRKAGRTRLSRSSPTRGDDGCHPRCDRHDSLSATSDRVDLRDSATSDKGLNAMDVGLKMRMAEQIKITPEDGDFIIGLKPSNASEFLSLLRTTCIAKAKDSKCPTYQAKLAS